MNDEREVPIDGPETEPEAAAPTAPETPTRRRARERRPTERTEMEIAIEAILFVSSEPVPRGKLAELFDEEDRAEAESAIDAVLERFGPEVGRGFMAEEVAGGVRLATRPELVGWLRRFFEVASGNKLSMAALETLAIVAYRQPITGPEIQELRNVSAIGTLKTLLERRLVRIMGRKEVVGKPFLYGTTREFLVHFGLKSLADLPPLEEFEETFGSDSNLVDRSLDAAAEAGAESTGDPNAQPAGERPADLEADYESATHVADLSAADESRERELLEQSEEIEARQEASESVEAGSRR
jgi:segregation and condensation protein B